MCVSVSVREREQKEEGSDRVMAAVAAKAAVKRWLRAGEGAFVRLIDRPGPHFIRETHQA